VTTDLTFSDLYDYWEPEEGLVPTGPIIPTKVEGWAVDLLTLLGFKLQTHDRPQIDPWHQGDTIYLTPNDTAEDVRHELAHAIVWLAQGKAGGPQQWGVGSTPSPRTRALEQELLVRSVEWVLTDKYETAKKVRADALRELTPSTYSRDSDPILRPEIILEASLLVGKVLPSHPEGVSP